jgi:hypothetical protein
MVDDSPLDGTEERYQLLSELQLERNQLLRNIEYCRIRDIDSPFIGEWSLKDIVGHVASWEAEVIVSLRAVREGRRPPLLDFDRADIDEWNADHVERKRDLDFWSLLQQLRSSRERLLGEVARIPDSEFADDSSDRLALVRQLVSHDREHWHQIAAVVAGADGARKPRVSGAVPQSHEPAASAD